MKRRLAVIPAFEPDEALTEISRELSDNGIEVIIVNDGSPDDYNDIFRESSNYATVLSYKENHGKGYALKYAYKHILRHYDGNATIVTADADGQHRRHDIMSVLLEAASNKGSIIIGSRILNHDAPLRSRFGNAVTRFVFSLSTGCKVYDTQSGLRAFDYSLLPFMLSIEGNRYEYEMNVLLSAARDSVKIKEISIETVYRAGNSSSHFNPLKDSYRIYKEIIMFTASSFISFIIDFCLYSFFCVIFQNMTTALSVSSANICARIISATVNFNINRKIVFKSNSSFARSVAGYFGLALGIMIANTFFLNLLVNYLFINRFAAKLICELFFFLISWTVQHFFVFARKDMVRQSS